MSMSDQSHKGHYVLYVHVESKYMNMHKILKVYIFVIEHGADIISVSF